MSLRAFHLFFIGMSVVLAAFFATWAGSEYRLSHEAVYALASAAAIASGAGMAVYGALFQRKTRRL